MKLKLGVEQLSGHQILLTDKVFHPSCCDNSDVLK